ncbi:hypothetical protein DY000_02022070 [Brassica cretica]|uniref:Uncharacterized protein n=1 Tax=Brassica cretica TaxID=69181 RepID=A0ABQ7E6Y1_BRACR|nr:hypothetical protein DY000_02022070 [Brassica cretica]
MDRWLHFVQSRNHSGKTYAYLELTAESVERETTSSGTFGVLGKKPKLLGRLLRESRQSLTCKDKVAFP